MHVRRLSQQCRLTAAKIIGILASNSELRSPNAGWGFPGGTDFPMARNLLSRALGIHLPDSIDPVLRSVFPRESGLSLHSTPCHLRFELFHA